METQDHLFVKDKPWKKQKQNTKNNNNKKDKPWGKKLVWIIWKK